MTKKKQFIVLAAAAVLLLTAYFAIQGYSKWKENKTSEEEEAKLVITSLDEDAITKLSYSGESGDFAFSEKDDEWYYDGDAKLPLKQSCVTGVLDEYSQLSGTRKFDDPDSKEAYGLDSPAYTIVMEDADGNSTEVKIGDATGEEYYVTADDGKTVYTAESSIIDLLVFDKDSLIQYETFPTISESNFRKIAVTEDGKTLLEHEATDSEEDSDSSDESEEDSDSSLTETYAEELASIYFDTCVTYNASSKKLAGYGLDEASCKQVEVTYEDSDTEEEATVTFCLGDTIDDTSSGEAGYVYIRLADSNMVYQIDASDVENLLAL